QRPAPAGLQPLEARSHSGEIYIPRSGATGGPLPILILLHGSGRDSSDWFPAYEKYAEMGRFAIVAPEASGKTWGGGMHDFGPDAAVINRALAVASTKCAIDLSRIALGGFSDGASYAMSLGLANGDQIRDVIAFSPGYYIGTQQRGKAAFFISAGVSDPILPVDQCSRRFVATLRGAGYSVEYKEFFGRHEMTTLVTEAAMAWLRQRWRR
ncbi:MAG: phospholipase, partial [Verrucomicrobiota bacterium]|nr:phospholipase [Verrucomicrobiota bacterium]